MRAYCANDAVHANFRTRSKLPMQEVRALSHPQRQGWLTATDSTVCVVSFLKLLTPTEFQVPGQEDTR